MPDLLSYNLDNIPKYLYFRDIENKDPLSKEMSLLKKNILANPHVVKVLEEQWEDGSWGRFHSMNTSSNSSMTTEKALRRLLNLGLDKNDEPIKRAIKYMESYLMGEIELRDYNEKKHDWQLITKLFVATWLLRIDDENKLALEVATKWAEVIKMGCLDGEYNETNYLKAYDEILKPEKNKAYWKVENFYMVSILKNLLDRNTEFAFIKHLMNSEKGIYYIYDRKVLSVPECFSKKDTNRYLSALDLILEYESAKKFIQPSIDWLQQAKGQDGLWDIGKEARDNMVCPLSNSWRLEINRKIDCSIQVMKIIKKAKNVL